jgi:hypothetical protein
MRAFSSLAGALLVLAVACPEHAAAQVQAITERDLTQPWIHATAALRSLVPASPKQSANDRSELDRQLSELDDELAALQAQEEKTAIRIVAVPEFVYGAAESSAEMCAPCRHRSLLCSAFWPTGTHSRPTSFEPSARGLKT